ncbi:carbon storage regulator [Botrimarina sp.]|uniref:carbon storage regulator n=1 Tax=Botrimarina sp. TaxID=2795802 RepID=UPI0032EF4071
MLVLTRKPQEKIRIGDDITITVIKTKGQGVRLGIEAPAHVPVLRGELAAARDTFAADSNDQTPHGDRPAAHAGADGAVVRYTRVKKSRVQSVLPKVLGDAGPLREMLDRRHAASA